MKLNLNKTQFTDKSEAIAYVKANVVISDKLAYKNAHKLIDAKGETITEHAISTGEIVIVEVPVANADTTSPDLPAASPADSSTEATDKAENGDEMTGALARAIQKLIATESAAIAAKIDEIDGFLSPMKELVAPDAYNASRLAALQKAGIAHDTALAEVNARIESGKLVYSKGGKSLVVTRELIERANSAALSPSDVVQQAIDQFVTDNAAVIGQIESLVSGLYNAYVAKCAELDTKPTMHVASSGKIAFVNTKASARSTGEREVIHRTVKTSDKVAVIPNLKLEKTHSSGCKAQFISDDKTWTITAYSDKGVVTDAFTGALEEDAQNVWQISPSSATNRIYQRWTSPNSRISAPQFWQADFYVGQTSPTAS